MSLWRHNQEDTPEPYNVSHRLVRQPFRPGLIFDLIWVGSRADGSYVNQDENQIVPRNTKRGATMDDGMTRMHGSNEEVVHRTSLSPTCWQYQEGTHKTIGSGGYSITNEKAQLDKEVRWPIISTHLQGLSWSTPTRTPD